MRPNFDLTEVGNLNSGKIHAIWGSVCAMSPKTVQWKSWSFSAYPFLPPQFITILGFLSDPSGKKPSHPWVKNQQDQVIFGWSFFLDIAYQKNEDKQNRKPEKNPSPTTTKKNRSRDNERGRAFKTPVTCLGQAMPELLDFQLCEQVNSFISISQVELFSIICSQKSNCQEKK